MLCKMVASGYQLCTYLASISHGHEVGRVPLGHDLWLILADIPDGLIEPIRRLMPRDDQIWDASFPAPKWAQEAFGWRIERRDFMPKEAWMHG